MKSRRLLLLVLSSVILSAATPMRTADPLKLMSFMTGTWTCSSTINGQTQTYTAHWEYALGNKWLRQVDTWSGGGDMGMVTYVPRSREWRWVVTEGDGDVTLFRAPDTGLAHITYRSVYPDATMSETYDRVSQSKYTTHFVQTENGKTTRAIDVCTKNG